MPRETATSTKGSGMPRTNPFTSRAGRLAAVLAVVVAAFVGGGLRSVSAAAAVRTTSSPPTVSLGGDGVATKTSNGMTWLLGVGDSNESGSLSVSLDRIATTGKKGVELHGWDFDNSPASSLTFDTKTGSGTVKGGSYTAPIATVYLTFTATSHKAVTCQEGHETIYSGRLRGTVKLVTGLPGGGTVGGTSLNFDAKGSAPVVEVDSDCVTNANDCTTSEIFSSPSGKDGVAATGFEETIAGKPTTYVGVIRTVRLKAPRLAERLDEALSTPTRGFVWNSRRGVLGVTTTSTGMVTGSATLSGGTQEHFTTSCKYNGKTYKVTAVDDTNAKYSSPRGQAITAHTSLTGALAAPQSGTGDYFIETVS